MLCGSIKATAQIWNFGVEGGYVFNNVAHHGSDVAMHGLNGFRVGVLANCRFDNQFIIDEGVYFKRMGVEQGNIDATPGSEQLLVQHMDYVALQLSLGYRIVFNSSSTLIPQVGLYAGMGVHNNTQRFTSTQQYDDGAGFPANDSPVVKPESSYDAGFQAGLAYEYRYVRLKAYYECQLNKLYTRSGNNLRFHSFGLSIAFFLRDTAW